MNAKCIKYKGVRYIMSRYVSLVYFIMWIFFEKYWEKKARELNESLKLWEMIQNKLLFML